MTAPEALPAHHAFPDVALADVVAELRREAAARRRLYPRLAEKGRMTAAEVAEGHAVIAALLADCERIEQRRPWAETHDFTWAQRRAALQRELAWRARLYPKWIAAGELDQAEADLRNRRLQALLWTLEDGFDWRPGKGLPMRDWPPLLQQHDEGARAGRLDWHCHAFTVHLGRGNFAVAEGNLTMIRQFGPAELAEDLAARLHAQRQPEQQKEMAL